jgi:hypothetical protein
MKTKSGVKPKVRGNATIVALLFVLCSPLFSQGSIVFCNDTIIIGGEVLEIEVEDVLTNTDSLRKSAREDIKRKKGLVIGGFHLHGGPAMAFSKFEWNNDDFRSVNEFVGKPAEQSFGFAAGADLSIYFTSYFGLRAGVSISNVSTRLYTIDRLDLSPDSTRNSFEFVNDEIIENSTIFISPGFEERSKTIDYLDQRWRYRVIDFPITCVFSPGINISEKLTGTFEIGGVMRFTSPLDLPQYVDFINEEGNFERTPLLANRASKSTFLITGAACITYKINKGWWLESRACIISRQRDMYSSSVAVWNASNVRIEIGVVRVFDWNHPKSIFSSK